MSKINYLNWLNGNDCCQQTRDCGCEYINLCDCDEILLELSKLHTDDLILQDLIDELSGKTSGGCECDLTDYYTKEEVDDLIPDVPSLDGYATEQWVENKGYLTEHQPIKTINNQSLIGNGNITIESVDAYTKQESDAKYQEKGDYLTKASGDTIYQPKGDYALKSEIPTVPNVVSAFLNDAGYLTQHQSLSGYVDNSTLLQYVASLQEQIDSLKGAISGCCGQTGETYTRWITMTGENDYWCSGSTKMSKEKEQTSTDNINWTDTGNIRSGSTVLEENCVECGYTPPTPTGSVASVQNSYSSTTSPTKIANICGGDVSSIGIAGNPNPTTITGCSTTVSSALTRVNVTFFRKATTVVAANEYAGTDLYDGSVSSEITSIGNGAFANNEKMRSFKVGNYSHLDPTNQYPTSNIQSIGDNAFSGCTSLKNFEIEHSDIVPTLGSGAFNGCPLEAIWVKPTMVNAFKTAAGWSQYSNIIQAL